MQNTPKMHIWPEGAAEQEGLTAVRFTLEKVESERIHLWYQLPSEFGPFITKGSEPFLLACLFTAMRSKTDIMVHGEISPTLLRNLEEFQIVWELWCPGLYKRIDIYAENEQEQPIPSTSAALAAFSGGVDSCFTAWRHKQGKAGRGNQNLSAAVMIHGLDIPIGRKATFERAKDKAKILLDSLGIELIPMVMNLNKLGENKAHSHGSILASSLMLLQGGFIAGLIAGSHSYADLYFPWGSTPLTDPLLSSESFPIFYDSPDAPRNIKVREIASWPEAQRYLRVCLGKDRTERDKNCGRCEKCIRTILNYRALGLGLPACFEHDASLSRIGKLCFQNVKFLHYYNAILEDARNSKVTGGWTRMVQLMIFTNRMRHLITRSTPIKSLQRKIQQIYH